MAKITTLGSKLSLLLVLSMASLQFCLSARAVIKHEFLQRQARHLLALGMPPMSFHDMDDGLKLSSCSYHPIIGTCEATHNYLLGAAFNLSGVPYGGRAAAFIIAGNAYCNQFSRTSVNCSYPCQNNGENCVLAGALTYGIYACPDSQAQNDVFCMEAPAVNKSLCKETKGCKEISSPNGKGPTTCMADFKSKLTSNQFRQYLADWGTTRRNVWGCCNGSNAKWMDDVYCSRFSSFKDECTSQPECIFNEFSGDCNWLTDVWLDISFGHGNMTQTMKEIAKQCSTITDVKKCNSHHPVLINASMVNSILSFDLSSINHLVNESECVVWNQDDQQ